MLLLEMLRKDKSDQEAVACLVLEVVMLKPLISPQPAQTLYETRHKTLLQPFQLCLIKSHSLSLGSTHFEGGIPALKDLDTTQQVKETEVVRVNLHFLHLTLFAFNRIFLGCLKYPLPCLRKQPQKGNVWSPTRRSIA